MELTTTIIAITPNIKATQIIRGTWELFSSSGN
jgi:hypothetical protein